MDPKSIPRVAKGSHQRVASVISAKCLSSWVVTSPDFLLSRMGRVSARGDHHGLSSMLRGFRRRVVRDARPCTRSGGDRRTRARPRRRGPGVSEQGAVSTPPPCNLGAGSHLNVPTLIMTSTTGTTNRSRLIDTDDRQQLHVVAGDSNRDRASTFLEAIMADQRRAVLYTNERIITD